MTLIGLEVGTIFPCHAFLFHISGTLLLCTGIIIIIIIILFHYLSVIFGMGDECNAGSKHYDKSHDPLMVDIDWLLGFLGSEHLTPLIPVATPQTSGREGDRGFGRCLWSVT